MRHDPYSECKVTKKNPNNLISCGFFFYLCTIKNIAMDKTICILAGARPNFVKVSPLVRAIGRRSDAKCLLVYAGCEDDPTLEPSLFDDLQIERPKYYLGVVRFR